VVSKTSDRISIGQVARLLNVSTTRVEQLAAQGRLSFERTSLGRLFDVESVHRLAHERVLQAERDARVRLPAIRS